MKKRLVLLLFIPLLSSCLLTYDYQSSSLRDYESASIENALSGNYETYDYQNVSIYLEDREVFKDIKLEILDAFNSLDYEETDLDSLKNYRHIYSYNYILRYGGGEDNPTGIYLHDSLEFVETTYSRDLGPTTNRYYKVDKSKAEKIVEIAKRVKEEYLGLVEIDSNRGTFEDYVNYKKPNAKPSYKIKSLFEGAEYKLKKDYHLLIFDVIKNAPYTLTTKPENEVNYVLIYDTNKNIEKDSFGWEYSLSSDFQLVKLDYIFYRVQDDYTSKKYTRQFYYEISKEEGESIYETAKKEGSFVY